MFLSLLLFIKYFFYIYITSFLCSSLQHEQSNSRIVSRFFTPKYLLHAHLVFTLKHRKKILTKAHLERMREVFEGVCKDMDAQLVEFDGEDGYVHLLVTYPPRISIAVLVNSLKGVSSRMLRKEFSELKKAYHGDTALWDRSYFAASVGGAPIEILKQYIEQQNAHDCINLPQEMHGSIG